MAQFKNAAQAAAAEASKSAPSGATFNPATGKIEERRNYTVNLTENVGIGDSLAGGATGGTGGGPAGPSNPSTPQGSTKTAQTRAELTVAARQAKTALISADLEYQKQKTQLTKEIAALEKERDLAQAKYNARPYAESPRIYINKEIAINGRRAQLAALEGNRSSAQKAFNLARERLVPVNRQYGFEQVASSDQLNKRQAAVEKQQRQTALENLRQSQLDAQIIAGKYNFQKPSAFQIQASDLAGADPQTRLAYVQAFREQDPSFYNENKKSFDRIERQANAELNTPKPNYVLQIPGAPDYVSQAETAPEDIGNPLAGLPEQPILGGVRATVKSVIPPLKNRSLRGSKITAREYEESLRTGYDPFFGLQQSPVVLRSELPSSTAFATFIPEEIEVPRPSVVTGSILDFATGAVKPGYVLPPLKTITPKNPPPIIIVPKRYELNPLPLEKTPGLQEFERIGPNILGPRTRYEYKSGANLVVPQATTFSILPQAFAEIGANDNIAQQISEIKNSGAKQVAVTFPSGKIRTYPISIAEDRIRGSGEVGEFGFKYLPAKTEQERIQIKANRANQRETIRKAVESARASGLDTITITDEAGKIQSVPIEQANLALTKAAARGNITIGLGGEEIRQANLASSKDTTKQIRNFVSDARRSFADTVTITKIDGSSQEVPIEQAQLEIRKALSSGDKISLSYQPLPKPITATNVLEGIEKQTGLSLNVLKPGTTYLDQEFQLNLPYQKRSNIPRSRYVDFIKPFTGIIGSIPFESNKDIGAKFAPVSNFAADIYDFSKAVGQQIQGKKSFKPDEVTKLPVPIQKTPQQETALGNLFSGKPIDLTSSETYSSFGGEVIQQLPFLLLGKVTSGKIGGGAKPGKVKLKVRKSYETADPVSPDIGTVPEGMRLGTNEPRSLNDLYRNPVNVKIKITERGDIIARPPGGKPIIEGFRPSEETMKLFNPESGLESFKRVRDLTTGKEISLYKFNLGTGKGFFPGNGGLGSGGPKIPPSGGTPTLKVKPIENTPTLKVTPENSLASITPYFEPTKNKAESELTNFVVRQIRATQNAGSVSLKAERSSIYEKLLPFSRKEKLGRGYGFTTDILGIPRTARRPALSFTPELKINIPKSTFKINKPLKKETPTRRGQPALLQKAEELEDLVKPLKLNLENLVKPSAFISTEIKNIEGEGALVKTALPPIFLLDRDFVNVRYRGIHDFLNRLPPPPKPRPPRITNPNILINLPDISPELQTKTITLTIPDYVTTPRRKTVVTTKPATIPKTKTGLITRTKTRVIETTIPVLDIPTTETRTGLLEEPSGFPRGGFFLPFGGGGGGDFSGGTKTTKKYIAETVDPFRAGVLAPEGVERLVGRTAKVFRQIDINLARSRKKKNTTGGLFQPFVADNFGKNLLSKKSKIRI